LYPHNQKIEIEVSLQSGIALKFRSVFWVVVMLCSSLTTSVATRLNDTTSTCGMVHTSFRNITNHYFSYLYVPQYNMTSSCSGYSLHEFDELCSSRIYRPSWHWLPNDSYDAEWVHHIYLVNTGSFSILQWCKHRRRVKHHSEYCFLGIWNKWSVNHQFYYIYYYYDTSMKARIQLNIKEILNLITDTMPYLQATLYHLPSYFQWLITYSQCW
jgi:hypothetical protein